MELEAKFRAKLSWQNIEPSFPGLSARLMVEVLNETVHLSTTRRANSLMCREPLDSWAAQVGGRSQLTTPSDPGIGLF